MLALALAGRYTFHRLLAIDGALAAAVLLLGRGRLRYRGAAARLTWSALVPVGLVAIGLWLYFPPSEYIIGGKDPGTYINEGVQLAQRGTIVVRDPVVSSVPAPVRDLFFPAYRLQLRWYYSLRFPGFFVQDPNDGRVVGEFPHLFPASIAVGYGLNGLSGARQAVGVWAILGLIAVYLTGARLFGRTAGAAAAVLLSVNVAQVWFARYPVSELPMQVMLFGALLAFGRAVDGSRGFFGAVAAVLLAGMLFLRYDVVLAFATFAGAIVLLPVERRRLGRTFLAVAVPITVGGYAYLVGPMKGYAAYPLDYTRRMGGLYLIGGGLLAGFVAWRLLRIERMAGVVRRVLPPVIAVGVVALAVYAYFFRHEGGRLALGDAMAFRTLGWYLTPLGLAIGVAATAWIVRRSFWRDPAFFLTFVGIAAFFSYKTRIVPEHFWTARRFLPMIIPGALLLSAALAVEIARTIVAIRRPKGGRLQPGVSLEPPAFRPAVGIVALLLLCPLGWLMWRQTTPILHHVEYAGVIPQLEQLAARIGDRDLVIVEARDAGSDLFTLAVPLVCIYARNALVLASAAPDKAAFEEFVAWAAGRYDQVWFLGGGGTDLLTRRVSASSVGGGQFQVPEYASTLNAYPTELRRKDYEYGLYRLDVSNASPAEEPITLEVGGNDDLQVVRFYARERMGDTQQPFRWTTAQSFVVLPTLPEGAREVIIWMSNGGRPPQAPAATVELAVDDVPVGEATVTGAMAPHTFSLPADIVRAAAARRQPVRLRLRVPTWNPRDLLGAGDTRDLGVMVTRVEVR